MPTLRQRFSNWLLAPASTPSPRTGEIAVSGGNSFFLQRDPVTGLVIERESSSITYAEMEEMQSDPQVASCLGVLTMPVLALDWDISCEDEGNTEIPEFVQHALKRIWQPLSRNLTTALSYGWSFQEKRWENEDGKWLWKTPTPVHPKELRILRDGNSFAGVEQQQNNAQWVPIPAEKCLVWSYMPQFGNMYGTSRLRGCYNPWWMKKHLTRFLGVYYERQAQPLLVGHAPGVLEVREGGVTKNEDAMAIMLKIQKAFKAGATSASLPSDQYDNGNLKWTLEYLETTKDGQDWIQALDYCNVQISRGMFVPDLTTQQNSQTGSRAMGDTHSDMFWAAEAAIFDEIKGCLDAYLLPQIVAYNFGTDAPACHFEYQETSPNTVAWLKQLVALLISGKRIMPDLEEISERLGLKLEEKEAQATAPVVPGQPGDKAKGATGNDDPEDAEKPVQAEDHEHDYGAVYW